MKKRAGWIKAAQNEFELYLPKQPPRQFISGESHRYLGRQYRLKAVQGKDESVKRLRGYLWVTAKDTTDKKRVKTLLEGWYRERARQVFFTGIEKYQKRLNTKSNHSPPITIRKMTMRWGSCSTDGRITLNLELIKAPTDCIEYVILHELCHLVERHHGPRFWRLLRLAMPDYEKRRRRLNMYADL